MRTGKSSTRRTARHDYNTNKPRSNFQTTCLPWLHEQNIAMLNADIAQDPTPSDYRTVNMPIHILILVCALQTQPSACTPETAIDVTQGPRVANELMCGRMGQAVLAATALAGSFT